MSVVSWICPATGDDCKYSQCKTRANRRAWGTNTGAGLSHVCLNGMVSRQDCKKVRGPQMKCGKGTCHFQAILGTCSHGHGLVSKPVRDCEDELPWLQNYGRGCCPICKKKEIGIRYVEGTNPHATN